MRRYERRASNSEDDTAMIARVRHAVISSGSPTWQGALEAMMPEWWSQLPPCCSCPDDMRFKPCPELPVLLPGCCGSPWDEGPLVDVGAGCGVVALSVREVHLIPAERKSRYPGSGYGRGRKRHSSAKFC